MHTHTLSLRFGSAALAFPTAFVCAAMVAGCFSGTIEINLDESRTYSGIMAFALPPQPAVDEMLAEISADLIKSDVELLASFGTRHTLSDTESDTRGIGAARRWIKSEFDRYAAESGRPATGDDAIRTSFDVHRYGPDGRRVNREVEVVNVIAMIPGSMPEARHRRVYVIGHYDSRNGDANDVSGDAPGANDDASGTAVVMELARVMSRRHYDCTIVFMATAGEEQGLLGARLHAEKAAAEGVVIDAVLSNDIVGDPSPTAGDDADADSPHWPLDKTIRVFSEAIPRNPSAEQLAQIRALSAESDSPSRQLARYVAEVAARHQIYVQPRLINRADRFLRGGDHSAFNEFNYTAVRFTVVDEHYDRQHQNVTMVDDKPYGDVPEFVNGEYLANVARVNGAALAHLANAPSAPRKARIITANLANDTTLRWSPSPEPDIAGYEIVMRDTTSNLWMSWEDVGNVTEITLPYSKDNVFFGVRAYDTDGYRSLVSFPIAANE